MSQDVGATRNGVRAALVDGASAPCSPTALDRGCPNQDDGAEFGDAVPEGDSDLALASLAVSSFTSSAATVSAPGSGDWDGDGDGV